MPRMRCSILPGGPSAVQWKLRQRAAFLHTARTATVLSLAKQEGGKFFSTLPWEFPQPPPPPSTDELHKFGLPLLRQAALHAAEGRILLSGWTHEGSGTVEIASYRDVLTQARLVSRYIYSNNNTGRFKDYKEGSPKLIAHLNVPGWDYVATQYGVWGAGYGSVPLALSQKVSEIEHVLRDSDPHHIVIGGNCRLEGNTATKHNQPEADTILATHSPKNGDQLLEAAKNLGMSDRVVQLSDILEEDHQPQEESDYWLGSNGIVDTLDDPALVLYTSGTTSSPKGTLITHRNIYHQVTDLVAAWEWKPSDVAVHVLPLHHVHGVVNLLSCAAYVGARLEFQPFNAEALWHKWATDKNESKTCTANFATATVATQQDLPKPTLLMAVPTIYAKLLESADNVPNDIVKAAVSNTLQPMRLMVSGSAALPVSVLHQWKKLTGHTLLERYGMTEIAMCLSNPYREDQDDKDDGCTPPERQTAKCVRRPGYVGLPLPSVQVRLVSSDTDQVVDTPGTSGELQVKGPTVFQRYLNGEDATREAFTEDGYFRTGDIAQYDGGTIQSYRILGRASVDIIKTGGHKLSALEIERELLEHPDIAEVAVLGVPDDVWGERVAAICRMKPDREDVTVEGLRIFCSDKISKEKVPSRLLIVQDIPKNAMGKINKKNLAALLPSEPESSS